MYMDINKRRAGMFRQKFQTKSRKSFFYCWWYRSNL